MGEHLGEKKKKKPGGKITGLCNQQNQAFHGKGQPDCLLAPGSSLANHHHVLLADECVTRKRGLRTFPSAHGQRVLQYFRGSHLTSMDESAESARSTASQPLLTGF